MVKGMTMTRQKLSGSDGTNCILPHNHDINGLNPVTEHNKCYHLLSESSHISCVPLNEFIGISSPNTRTDKERDFYCFHTILVFTQASFINLYLMLTFLVSTLSCASYFTICHLLYFTQRVAPLHEVKNQQKQSTSHILAPSHGFMWSCWRLLDMS